MVKRASRWCDDRWSEVRTQVIPPKNRSIRVGTVLGKMTTTKQHTAPEGEEHKKDQSGKKVPLGPQVHTGDVPGD